MTASWDNLTPIDDNNQVNAPVSWDTLAPEDEDKKTYKRPAGDKGWEISATPKEDTTLLGRLGKTLRWVAQTPIIAYMQGEKNVESAELNAKEMFQPLSDAEKNKLNTIENAERANFGVPTEAEELAASHTGDLADWASEGGPERFMNQRKRGYAENFENLTTSVEVAKAGGIGSVVVGGVGAIGGALWGLRKGHPIEGALDGFKVGVRLGGGTGAARKSFELEAGFARQELKQMRDKDGNPLPEDLIKNASIGVGVVNSALESIGLVAELKTFPGMDKLFFKSKKDLIKDIAENETLRDKLIQVGKTYAKGIGIESSTEMVQECSNILSEELSKKIAGNYNDTLFEDGKINNEVLSNHIGRVVKAGVSAVGPSVIIGGLGTAMTAANILRKNGMSKEDAQATADNMNVDERADFINQNIDALDEIAQDHITEMEAQDIEKNFFDKASEVYKDADGNLSAEKENQVLSAAKIAGAFAKKFGSNKQQVQDWFDKLSFQNKPVETLQGGVSMEVQASKEIPFDQLKMEDIPEVQFQKSAAFAGTASKDEALDAAKAWQEQKTESPYFKKWFGDSKVVDNEGSPLVVYHGTRSKFDTFDKTKTGQASTAASVGFWFTDSSNFADNFADETWYGEEKKPVTMPVYINLKNPKIFEPKNIDNIDLEKSEKMVDLLNKEKQELISQKNILAIKTGSFSKAEEVYRGQIDKVEQELKLAQEKYEDLYYQDPYEQFKTGIYKVAGQSAEEANIGGLGMSLNDKNTTIEKFVNDLKEQGYDGIIIKDTRFDSDSAGTDVNTQYVAFSPEQIKSVDNEGTFSKDTGNIYHQFAGQKAQTVDRLKLQEATERLDAGEKPEAVRKSTGWFKGIDGKMRFEISDKDAEFLPTGVEMLSAGETEENLYELQKAAEIEKHQAREELRKVDDKLEILYELEDKGMISKEEYTKKNTKYNNEYDAAEKKLEAANEKYSKCNSDRIDFLKKKDGLTVGDVLAHDKLFTAYPGLKDVSVDFYSSTHEQRGSFSERSNEISLNTSGPKETILKTLMHEIQHYIQHEEGFANGGNLKSRRKAIDKVFEKYEEAIDNELENISKTIYLEYLGSEKKLEKALKLKERAWNASDNKNWREDEQKFYAMFGGEENYKKDIHNKIWIRRNEVSQKYKDLAVSETDKLGSDEYEYYSRLAGEVEARNTAKRINIGDVGRKSISPEETQDVKNADAIVVFDDGAEVAYSPDNTENKENTYFQSVYHGSPYKFDKFSLEHLGSGEGAQAYGWGLYFAGNKEVAEYYKNRLGQQTFKKDGVNLTRDEAREQYYTPGNLVKTYGGGHDKVISYDAERNMVIAQAVVEKNGEYINDTRNYPHPREYYGNVDNRELAAFMGRQGYEEGKGLLYKAEIPEDTEMLDWDKNITEQSKSVQEVLSKLFEEGTTTKIIEDEIQRFNDMLDEVEQKAEESGGHNAHSLYAVDMYENKIKEFNDLLDKINNSEMNGEDVYSVLTTVYGGDEEASLKLNELGISGIKYLDGSSRSKGEGHHNYVVFDDKAIDIVKTYYQDKKSLEDLHEDNAINKKQKALEYLGYFKEGQEKNIIGIMQDANPSTIVHEMGHLFLQGLNEFSQKDEDAKAMLDEVNEWLGYTGEGYSVDQHEKFARGFEAYLYNGKAPSNTLREVFENFKVWLHSIYNHVDELGVKITPEVQRIFDNMFSDKSEKQNPVKELVEKAKNISINGKLGDSELRHKEVAYHILSVATGKSKTWLKTVLESNSENPRVLKNKEKIELLSEKVGDRISGSDGFLPEWSEFFFNPGIGSETHADYQLASAAYNTIVDKSYLNNRSDQFGFLDVTEAQYQYLVEQFKKASDRDVPLAAFWEWLDSIEADFVMTYAEKYENDVAYIERFEKMDKFAQAKEMIIKAANEAGRYSINDIDKYKNIVMATIKGLSFLSPMAKARLTANILDYSSTALLEANIDNLLDVAKTIEDVEYKKRLVYSIHKALQFTKNIKQNNKTVGKYDYQTNKIFERMREIEALSAEEANEMRLEIGDIHEENGLSFEDKIINSFINYKANGLTFTSTESAKAMYDDIVKMKLAGKEAKNEQDFQNKLNLASDVIELVRVLDRKKVAKLPTKWYLQIAANWESMINGLFNQEMRNKYSLLAPQRLADGWIHNEKKSFEKQVAEIYGKTMFDFDDAIIKNLNTKVSFLENVEDVENVGEFRQVPREMNKMEMILAWMWDKNEVLHQRLLNQFGDIEIERMFNELSDDDMKLGNLMMQTVNKYYAPANEAFIKKYGIDLPKVANYFPSKVERISEIDLLTDFSMKSTDPSAIKHRSGSIGLSMDFDNPVKMLYQHVDSMGKFIHMTETLDKQNKIFKNKTLRKIIIEKYGEDIYNEMLKMFMNNAYKQEMTNFNWFSKQIDKLVSNWLIGNVAVKPSIAIKQLLSASNYASEMPYLKWKLGYLKAIADPKGTIEYMNKIPYLKARFEMGGQNEFLKNEINNNKLAKTARFKEWASVNIRMGDIGAIAFGGRPYLEYLMKEKGLSEEAAIKEFLDHTQRTMQASETSTLNNLQIAMAKGGFGSKLLTAYKNAQWQYLRMAGDSIVSYSNGDMTGSQMGKTLFMYLFMNPFLYRSATSLSLVTLLATGKGDDLKKDVLGSIFDLNADAVAVFGDLYQYAVGKLLLKEKGIPEKTPLVGDIQAHINKISKEDVGIEDWLDFAGYGTQVTTGVPINSVALSLSGAGDIAQGKYLKGSLKALGWSENRAAHASGEKPKKNKSKSKKHKLNLD